MTTDSEVPPEAVEAVLSCRWTGDLPWEAHANHNYAGYCAVCRGDVRPILGVAAPYIAAAALRQAAEEMWERTDGVSQVYSAWLRMRADQLDGRQPKPDTRDGILAAAGLTEEEAAGQAKPAVTVHVQPDPPHIAEAIRDLRRYGAPPGGWGGRRQ